MLAVRACLARLVVVVVGVLAGLVFAHGVPCTDGVTAMSIEQVANSGMVVGAAQDGAGPAMITGVEGHSPDDVTAASSVHQVTAVPGPAGVFAPDGDGSPGSHGLGGVLAACLMCIVAVVAVIVGLRPSLLRIVVALRRSGRGRRVIRVIPPRAPRLAELCLLRM